MDSPQRNAMAGLPNEAMLEILARTPFRSVCRSKCVAKAWRDLIEDPLNRGRLPQTLQGFFSLFCRMSNLEHFFIKYLASPVPLDIDPCLSFLEKLPETETVDFLDSCNGLLLFEHYQDSDPYIVCNPTTKHWATVPDFACCRPSKDSKASQTYLAFDPIVSSHFHLVHFWKGTCGEEGPLAQLHTYSSETGVWSHSQTDWTEHGQLEGKCHQINTHGCHQRTFVNGILHLIVSDLDQHQHQIVAVNLQRKTKRMITVPAATQRQLHHSSYIGHSQGRLHYINQYFDAHDSSQERSLEVSIWVLQDDTQEWMLKDTVSLRTIFGKIIIDGRGFVVIHPDRNVVFFVGPLNRLIAYDMDNKEVSVVATLSETLLGTIVPYVPYFSESPALTNKN